MKKALLSAAIMASLCLPAYADTPTLAGNMYSSDSKYDMPIFGDEADENPELAEQEGQRKHTHRRAKKAEQTEKAKAEQATATEDADVKDAAEDANAKAEASDEDILAEEVAKQDKEKKDTEETENKVVPVHLTAEHAEYDSSSGDFHASGNVVITQGPERLISTYAVGNMKTGDVWLEQGGTIKEPQSTMTGNWVHYNFNTNTGEIKEIKGKSLKDNFRAPHATIYPEKIVVDQGGVSARCPAVEHPPCLSIEAASFEIYPKEKMVAHDVKVFIRGKHMYSRDLWVNNLNEEDKTKIMPRFGYDGSDNGWYAKLEVAQPVTEKTMVYADLPLYSRAGYRPVYGVTHNERNFRIKYSNGWDEDDDIWYKKQNNWRFDYKRHHIVDGLPLSYSFYGEYGLWKRERERAPKITSWHKEYGVYLHHDPIYLFNSKNTVLNLTVGKKWVNESRTGDTVSSELFNATLGQKISDKWRTWVGYYSEHKTSQLFDINQPDMAKELRNGLQYKASDRDIFTIVNRFDTAEGKQYETDYRWLHKFCCWALEFTYEKEYRENKDNTFRVHYYFYNW